RVGQLEDALLYALELVARAREHEDQEEADHRGDRELGLPDADRLDQHDVVARRLADEERLPRPPRDTPERARGRARADEGLGRGREARHARLVAQDAAARERARRVDGEHGDLLPETDQMEAESLDEGALAHPGHAAHADAGGAARVGEHELEEPLRRALVVGARALDQRDRLGERAAAPRTHVGGQRLGAARRRWRHYAAVPPPSPISWSTRRAAFGIFVPGPKIAFTPALSRK